MLKRILNKTGLLLSGAAIAIGHSVLVMIQHSACCTPAQVIASGLLSLFSYAVAFFLLMAAIEMMKQRRFA